MVKLMRTLILSTFLYACESWTLTAEIERRIQALEMRCYRRLLNVSYKDCVTNEEVRNRIQNAIGVHDDPLTMIKKRKLRWYGHISRSSGMAKTILQGTVTGARRRGRQKKRWEGIVATSFVVPRWPPRLRNWDEMMRWDQWPIYEGHPINSENLFISFVRIEFAYQKYNLSVAYLVTRTTKHPKFWSDWWPLVA